jgi:hypothetical protein
MNATTKRWAIAGSVMLLAVAGHWLSGLSWDRSPELAAYYMGAVFLAVFGATCPFIEDDRS